MINVSADDDEEQGLYRVMKEAIGDQLIKPRCVYNDKLGGANLPQAL